MIFDFKTFFQAATDKPAPYAYQCRLACGSAAAPDKTETLKSGTACESRLIDIPTGLGKTAGVVLAWMYNRGYLTKPDWPRRFVYCLPVRTLVEQTVGEIEYWLGNIRQKASALGITGQALEDLQWLAKHSPVTPDLYPHL